VQRLIGVAADEHRVVIDAGRGDSAHLAAAARVAERVIVVATPNLRSARGAAALLAEMGSAARLVVNHVGRDEDLSVRALARICGARPMAELPRRTRDAEMIGSGRRPRGRRQTLMAAFDAMLDGGW